MLLDPATLFLLLTYPILEINQELELLPPDVIQSNPFISHPVLLEQYLMEGSYNKVFLGKTQVPSPYYTFFVDILLNTIRNEIASCREKAFNSIAVVDSVRLSSQILEYAVELEKIV